MNAAEIAGRLDLKKQLSDYRGACPACGYHGFSVRQGKGGKTLWQCWGCSDREAITDALFRVFGGSWEPPSPRSQNSEDQQARDRLKRAVGVWERAGQAAGSPAVAYLDGRCLPDLAVSDALRFTSCTSHPQGGPGLPAMVARVQDAAGETIGVHRTYLRRDGSGKAEVEPAKASLGRIWGGAIRLQPHQPGLALIVGEGIESAASAGIFSGLPAWAAISAGNLGGGLLLPPEVRDVIIAADPDDVGEQRAIQAAWRWQREGRTVRIARTRSEWDWNELLCRTERVGG